MSSIRLRTDPRHGRMLVWRKGLQRWLTRSSTDLILPNLLLGGSYAARNMSTIDTKEITFVLTIMSQDLPEETKQKYQEKGIDHHFVKKDDVPEENILEVFGELCNLLEEKIRSSKTVLVHCAMGISRSATIVMAYVMQRWGVSRSEAKQMVRAKRHVVNPNSGFYHQLKVWGKCNHDIHTTWMIDGKKQFKQEYQQWRKEEDEAEARTTRRSNAT